MGDQCEVQPTDDLPIIIGAQYNMALYLLSMHDSYQYRNSYWSNCSSYSDPGYCVNHIFLYSKDKA